MFSLPSEDIILLKIQANNVKPTPERGKGSAVSVHLCVWGMGACSIIATLYQLLQTRVLGSVIFQSSHPQTQKVAIKLSFIR